MRVALFACLALGCTVTRPDAIDEGFFACDRADECGPDQACAEGNVYSADFCRPACVAGDPSSCDGVCTARGACLERCTIGNDGQPSGCRSEDFTCVRTDAVRDEGVCYPVQHCSRSEDCPSDGAVAQLCLNDALGLPAASATDFRFDNLYCTARADDGGRCPTGYLAYEVTTPEGPLTLCYAPCGVGADGPQCPPATVCFQGAGDLIGTSNTPPCLTGVWGLPCVDDTQCLVGQCLDVGDGHRACTETCADAEAFGGCAALEGLSEYAGVTARMQCQSVGASEVCVPRFDLLSLCSRQLRCVADVQCLQLGLGGGTSAHFCVRLCTNAGDCAAGTGGVAGDYRCLASGLCMRKRSVGSRCVDDLDCRTGHCATVSGVSETICVPE